MNEPMITNDAVVFGLLMILLGIVFKTSASAHPFWKKFYTYVPSVLLCYFLPSIFNSLGVISGEESKLYFVASRYMLPASLVLLTISTDFKEIYKLGKKAVIMFLTGTVGIVIGGPISILFFAWVAPDIVGGDIHDVWRGMTTVAGSWIGGSANQAAMKEVFEVNDELFSKMVTVDVLVANAWMAVLLIGAGKSNQVDKIFGADSSAIEKVKKKIEDYQLSIAKIPSMADLMMLLAVGCGVTATAHFASDFIAPAIEANYPGLAQYSLTSGFFWLVVISTTIGLGLSFTKLRELEGVGASKIGSVFMYVLIATIGMKMNVVAIVESPGLFLVGIVWMLVHVGLLLGVAKLIKAPFFFVAVGSQANVGGAASAPIVASAFHPSLAPVGVLLAVLGYALGTYGAYLCGVLMQLVSGA
ncbi:DUF819 family protein [Reichenbachiella ulvae]|uniref:DUF819 family protein n=1 Tax=Reichenbachiella ulvae TaxID=2980104 RepID=A0ABT3CST2_9BACT|nr:DUF819 family protein [Reichenbachiella ulvae]MCV9386569.1 DUF819 family protein [Reichenbachiella ulvae]